ncbi:MAG: 30S ribosomal protein S15 [Parcubacteria group bacterium]|nr:30S ribosomal protein S15 [Parcubacteria group bacterium]
MAINERTKQRIISKFKTHESDTGSPEVQVALLSRKIEGLTGHLKSHRKDFDSRRGLLKMVGKRRRLLGFLKRENLERYRGLIKKLKIKENTSEEGIFATHLAAKTPVPEGPHEAAEPEEELASEE